MIKVGDIVQVRKDLKAEATYDGVFASKEMAENRGKVFMIEEMDDRGCAIIDGFYYTEEMFDLTPDTDTYVDVLVFKKDKCLKDIVPKWIDEIDNKIVEVDDDGALECEGYKVEEKWCEKTQVKVNVRQIVLSNAERNILSHSLDVGYFYFAKDDNGAGWLYGDKPIKNDGSWWLETDTKPIYKIYPSFLDIIKPGECVEVKVLLNNNDLTNLDIMTK